ncbi:MAG TPA: alanyl-tRNA editing protein [Sedimenticola thiotaurini]|uniref:Alanine--tRNA ligase n=1 Tax=Sedimenticola thiotaurini TaxID=1543721 RepID=A0A831RMA6_9GAMM|nr:alanyl-tRNA editing protein [Sedimenticola thiotaurini]
MTDELFREDGYLKRIEARVEACDERGVRLDRTIFYPTGGGQPGDTGRMIRADGSELQVVDTRKERESGELLHLLAEGSQCPGVGETVTLEIDWERRHRLMRMHSCMHLLCAVVPAGVTGGSVRDDGSARLDFDLPEPPDKEAIGRELNRLIQEDHPMEIRWITDQELEQQPELVRTMSVKPPTGSGRVRLVRFGDVDLQPCGGTHVASTAEIGPVRIRKIEKKGRRNRRITVVFDD